MEQQKEQKQRKVARAGAEEAAGEGSRRSRSRQNS